MALLQVSELTKRFGGLTAVDQVTFQLNEGDILAMIGPNGAGKTTVFNLITGIYTPDEGEIRYSGQGLIGEPVHRMAELGIARTFQNLRLFPNLTVLENVMSGQHPRSSAGAWASIFRSPAQRREEETILTESEKALQWLELWHLRDELAKNLPYGQQKRLEIARALATRPKLLILDEPAGGLNEDETADLMKLIREIRDSGVSIFLIEHDMKLVMGISDRVVVLDNGGKIAEGTPAEVQANPMVIEAYLGREEDEF